VDDIRQFYVDELRPFIPVTLPDAEQPVNSQRQLHYADEVSDHRTNGEATLYGSTQLVVDLAELAAEAGNVTLVAFDGVGCTPTTEKKSDEVLTMTTAAGETSEDTLRSIPLDGFCLQSASVNYKTCHIQLHTQRVEVRGLKPPPPVEYSEFFCFVSLQNILPKPCSCTH